MMRAKKSLGQHFLTDRKMIARIIEAVNPQSTETIIEIGPGKGALTAPLIERAGRVVAIEFDRELASLLRMRFGAHANFTLVEADALEVDFRQLIAPGDRARVVANLPYNISTAIIQRLLRQRSSIVEMVLMLQREVVWRILAPPGSSERGYLSVLIEAFCDAEKLFDVAPRAFRPVPKVWSSVVRLRTKREDEAESRDAETLLSIISVGFMQRRKTLLNNFRQATGHIGERIRAVGGAAALLDAAEINAQRRAESLTLAEWKRLAQALDSLEVAAPHKSLYDSKRKNA
ncbi:MAG: 16S rRNA (adenine(1518)-N(6)/adenine(1519)-N(6))-dimethyltransferase [Pyrinomonas sp.]